MHSLNRRVRFMYFFMDIALICFSLYLVFTLNLNLVSLDPNSIRSYLAIYLFWGIALIFSLHNARLYYTDRCLSILEEWLKGVKSVLFASVLAALFIFILKIDFFSRVIFIESSVLLLLSLSAWRAVKRLIIRHLIQKGYTNFNVLIVGAGRIGIALAKEIGTFPYLGIRTIGFLDDARTGERDGFKILGKISDIEHVVKKFFIDEIYITIPSERKISAEILQVGTELGKTVRIVAEHFGLPCNQMRLNYVGSIPLVSYFEKRAHGADGAVKRLLDIFVSGIVLILTLPLFVVVACLIKLESPGSVIYVSKRCGKKGAIFDLYKFRTMVKDADSRKEALKDKSEVRGPIFKIRKDPRLTRVGKFLRKYSVDELPQLINVLKGDMSLVGPRPFPVKESQRIEHKHIPRLNIKPGITGLAQIKGRSDLSFNHWMRWDTWYLHNWSLGLDLKVLLWTMPAVLRGKGAY